MAVDVPKRYALAVVRERVYVLESQAPSVYVRFS
jgi:hypothetical protein